MNLHDALQIRSLRNKVRGYMTHDTSYIGPLRQLIWWFTIGRGLQSILFRTNGKLTAYGYLTDRGGKQWITVAVDKAHRRKGKGKLMTELLMALCPGDVWLDVRADNTPARKLYQSLGFKHFGKPKDGIIVMVRRKDEPSATNI